MITLIVRWTTTLIQHELSTNRNLFPIIRTSSTIFRILLGPRTTFPPNRQCLPQYLPFLDLLIKFVIILIFEQVNLLFILQQVKIFELAHHFITNQLILLFLMLALLLEIQIIIIDYHQIIQQCFDHTFIMFLNKLVTISHIFAIIEIHKLHIQFYKHHFPLFLFFSK